MKSNGLLTETQAIMQTEHSDSMETQDPLQILFELPKTTPDQFMDQPLSVPDGKLTTPLFNSLKANIHQAFQISQAFQITNPNQEMHTSMQINTAQHFPSLLITVPHLLCLFLQWITEPFNIPLKMAVIQNHSGLMMNIISNQDTFTSSTTQEVKMNSSVT
jgi:hypothetical protein